jgi:hypothetical protein
MASSRLPLQFVVESRFLTGAVINIDAGWSAKG